MHKGRLEAFSDGVLAIILTIMVLELKTPKASDYQSLLQILPMLTCYLLSFIYVGIYWNNHHHLFQASHQVSGLVLWANLHLLFWLSLVPFTTRWLSDTGMEPWPVAAYGFVLLLAGFSFIVLTRVLIRLHGKNSTLAVAVGTDAKGIVSLALYLGAIPTAFYSPRVSCAIYAGVAAIWLIPDTRIERHLHKPTTNSL